MIIELENVRIDTLEEMVAMIGHGTETEVIGLIEVTEAIEVTGLIEECQGGMLGATTMRDRREEIGIFLRDVAIVAEVVDGVGEAIVMNSQCRWAEETGRRVPALHQRRRSLHRT